MTNIQNLRMWSYIHYNTSIILFSTGWFGSSSLCNASVQFLVISVIQCWRPWKDIAHRTPESSHLDQYHNVGTHQSASEKGENTYTFVHRESSDCYVFPLPLRFLWLYEHILFIPSWQSPIPTWQSHANRGRSLPCLMPELCSRSDSKTTLCYNTWGYWGTLHRPDSFL